MKTDKAPQATLARLFQKSQAWVSNMRNRTIDPMPCDLAGATAWGCRLGLLGASVAAGAIVAGAPAVSDAPLFSTPSAHGVTSSLEIEELRLKSARADLLETEHDLRTGKLMRVAEVEQRETAIAAEFRHCACEYPLRARAILERLIPDGALVDRIVVELQQLAAELLNKADARGALRGKTRGEIRAALNGWLDTVENEILALA